MITENQINTKIHEKDDLTISTLFKRNAPDLTHLNFQMISEPFNYLLNPQIESLKKLTFLNQLSNHFFYTKRRIIYKAYYTNPNSQHLLELAKHLLTLFNDDICRPVTSNLILLIYMKTRKFKAMSNLIDVVEEMRIYQSNINQDIESVKEDIVEEKEIIHKNTYKTNPNNFNKSNKYKKPNKSNSNKYNSDNHNEFNPDKKKNKKNTRPFFTRDNYKPTNSQTELKNSKVLQKDRIIFLFFQSLNNFLNSQYGICQEKLKILFQFETIRKIDKIKNEIELLMKMCHFLTAKPNSSNLNTNNINISSYSDFDSNKDINKDLNKHINVLLKNAAHFNLKILLPHTDSLIGLSLFHIAVRNLLNFCHEHFATDSKLNLSIVKALFYIKEVKGDEWFFYTLKCVEKGLVKGYLSVNREVMVFSRVDPFPEIQ